MDLSIEEDTIEAIVDLIEKESAGARAVKNIMNQFADNQYFYDMKMGGYDILRIHKGMLHGENPIFLKGGAKNGVGPRFPGPLLIRTRCPDTSPNSTL